jgi:hypothetical protein
MFFSSGSGIADKKYKSHTRVHRFKLGAQQ